MCIPNTSVSFDLKKLVIHIRGKFYALLSSQSICLKKLLWICELDLNETNSRACVIKHLSCTFPILMRSFNFTSVWFSWIFLPVFLQQGSNASHCLKPLQKRHVTKLTCESKHSPKHILTTLLSAILLQDILVGGGGVTKIITQ